MASTGEIATEVRNPFSGFGENARVMLRNKYIYAKMGRAVVEVKKSLRLSAREKDLTMVVGQRGVNLPADYLDIISARVDAVAAQNFEGYPLEIVDETQLIG